MHILDVVFFLTGLFVFRINGAITNEQTREKISNSSLWFNKYLETLRDSNVREVFKYFQRILIWVASISFGLTFIVLSFSIEIPAGLFIFLTYSFSCSTILAFSIWWAMNHKAELKSMFSPDRGLFSVLFLLTPTLMLLADHYYQTNFYEIIRNDPQFMFPPDISDKVLAILFSFSILFVFIIFPYALSIPVYLCLYVPLKGYVMYLKLVTKRFSPNLLKWSIILVDVIYSVWRVGFN